MGSGWSRFLLERGVGQAPQRARDPQACGVGRDMKLLSDLLVAELVKNTQLKRGTYSGESALSCR